MISLSSDELASANTKRCGARELWAIVRRALEVLVRYLDIRNYAVWPIEQYTIGQREKLVYVQHQAGESVHIIVGPDAPGDIPAAYSRDITAEGKQFERFRWKRLQTPDSQP
jgi:hypothetical protein